LDGLHIGNAPQFSFGLGTKFEVVKGLSFDADLNYYARLYGQMEIGSIDGIEQSEELAPYALMDAGVTYEFKFGSQKLRFRGNVYNLLNTSYIGRKDGFGYFYGLGRTYNAGIQFNF
jgi:outer membrane receptor protein involved in Fe transport